MLPAPRPRGLGGAHWPRRPSAGRRRSGTWVDCPHGPYLHPYLLRSLFNFGFHMPQARRALPPTRSTIRHRKEHTGHPPGPLCGGGGDTPSARVRRLRGRQLAFRYLLMLVFLVLGQNDMPAPPDDAQTCRQAGACGKGGASPGTPRTRLAGVVQRQPLSPDPPGAGALQRSGLVEDGQRRKRKRRAEGLRCLLRAWFSLAHRAPPHQGPNQAAHYSSQFLERVQVPGRPPRGGR